MSYDQRCYDLAEAFLDDEGVTEERCINSLAEHIQNAIEGWLTAELRTWTESERGLEVVS